MESEHREGSEEANGPARLTPAEASRLAATELDAALASSPAVALEGPPGSGKARLATARARTVLRLDDPAQRELVAADPTLLVTGERPIALVQWHHHPTSRDVVRLAARHDPRPRQLLLTGARIGADAGTEIARVPVRPLALAERRPDLVVVSLARLLSGARDDPPTGQASATSPLALPDYADEVTRSGLPPVREAADASARATALEALLTRVLREELPALGDHVRKPAVVRRWLRAVAAASATGAAREQVLAAAAGAGRRPTRASIQPHRQALEALGVVDPLPAWQPEPGTLPRLARSPAHHLADPALAAHLLDADATALLQGRRAEPPAPTDRALLGLLVTSLVVQSVRVCARAVGARTFHVRQHSGRRAIPLLVEGDDGRVVGLTVALGQVADEQAADDLRWLGARLGPRVADLVVVTTGGSAYRRRDGVAVVPAALLGP